MTSDNDRIELKNQQTSSETAENTSQRHQRLRRRLLKASAIAPVIYTLPNGSALAGTSNCYNSDINNTSQYKPGNVITVNVQDQQTVGSASSVDCVHENEKACKNASSNASFNNQTTTAEATSSENIDPPLIDNEGNIYTKSGDWYASAESRLYYFDGHSELIAQSCWASINGLAGNAAAQSFQKIV